MAEFIKKLFANKESREAEIRPDDLNTQTLPQHIAIIMDGNGRWAKKRGLPRLAGHRQGLETLKNIVQACQELGVPYLTVYAFSTENWKRPQDEVEGLMRLLVEYIQNELDNLNKKGVRVRAIGELERLPQEARRQVERAIDQTKENQGLNLQIALNYGGRREIVEALRAISREVAAGKVKPEQIDEELVSRFLYTAGIPDPDLLIRPSGELRWSNFLIWQAAYSEFWITNVLWPDFKPADLYRAVFDYQHRQRRYGGLTN